MIVNNDAKCLGLPVRVTYFSFTNVYRHELDTLLKGWNFVSDTNTVDMYFGANIEPAKAKMLEAYPKTVDAWYRATGIETKGSPFFYTFKDSNEVPIYWQMRLNEQVVDKTGGK